MFGIMRSVFRKYGYQPIETPSFELTSTLMGKYGEEGDRLIFKILNSGEKLKKADVDALDNNDIRQTQLLRLICLGTHLSTALRQG